MQAHEKLSYGTMTYIRAGIVRSARDVIARAVTIAIRCEWQPEVIENGAETIYRQTALCDDSSPTRMRHSWMTARYVRLKFGLVNQLISFSV